MAPTCNRQVQVTRFAGGRLFVPRRSGQRECGEPRVIAGRRRVRDPEVKQAKIEGTNVPWQVHTPAIAEKTQADLTQSGQGNLTFVVTNT